MSSDVVRSGPRHDIDVPLACLDAAEALMGDQGVDATTMRAIAREADVRVTTLIHHYATKQDVVAAVLRRRAIILALGTRERLEALDATAGTPDIGALIDTILTPMLDMLATDHRGGVRWLKIFIESAARRDALTPMGIDLDLALLFRRVAQKALPGLEVVELDRRLRLGVYSMLSLLAATDQRLHDTPLTEHGLDADFVASLRTFVAHGIAAS